MGSVEEVRVPDIGDFDAVDVIEVLVSVGDQVEREQSLITLESDKASLEVPSPVAGTIREVLVGEGDRVSEGTAIARIEASADKGESPAPEAPGSGEARTETAETSSEPDTATPAKAAEAAGNQKTPAEAPAEAPSPAADEAFSRAGNQTGPGASAPPTPPDDTTPERSAPVHASPAVRKFARELGVDLARVQGSGRRGRIMREDVRAFVKQTMRRGTAPGSATALQEPRVDFSRFGPTERVPLSRIQRKAGPHLQQSWQRIPHVTQFEEADVTEVETFRKALQGDAGRHSVKLTMLAVLLDVCAGALREFPRINSSLDPDGEHLILKQYVNIGVAVDTPNGLLVPVIRDADRKGVYQLARETAELAELARNGKLKPDHLQGGCFSISSLGGIGGTAFTPIINAPEVGILGVSRMQTRPVYRDGQWQPRLMLPLSFSYDHRVIDGAEAARFTSHLAQMLADPHSLSL